jgi:hypothetical protein
VSYLAWLVYPLLKSAQHHHAQWMPWAGAIMGAAVVIVGGILLVWRHRGRGSDVWRHAFFFGALWYVATTLPLAVASYFSPRHLYLTSAGFCLGLVLVADAWARIRAARVVLTIMAVLWSAMVFSEAIRPWRASAKVSERLATALAGEPTPREGEVWLIDAPPTFLGVWCWSWASPAALLPPFQAVRAATWLEHPEAHVAPHLWQDRCARILNTEPSRAVLFNVTARGQVERREVAAAVLGTALARLREELGKKPDAEVWKDFVTRLEAGGVAGGKVVP